ncbi:MAG: DUF47 family protein [Caldisericaceae bacterium]|nr:DUF47 family protein [Caldisericaceae bacterium]
MIFKKTRELEAQIDEYLDCVVEGALIFKQGIYFFLQEDLTELEIRAKELEKKEHQGDQLRRKIETILYEQTLIPESRGDVLGLLESTDTVLNTLSETLMQFVVEKPQLMTEIQPPFKELVEQANSAVEEMVAAIRAYFRNFTMVRDHITKVQFFEKESDKSAYKIKRIIFDSTLDLSLKMHMRDFVDKVENISDEAEDVCDRLTIAAIKRYL